MSYVGVVHVCVIQVRRPWKISMDKRNRGAKLEHFFLQFPAMKEVFSPSPCVSLRVGGGKGETTALFNAGGRLGGAVEIMRSIKVLIFRRLYQYIAGYVDLKRPTLVSQHSHR